MQSFAYDSTLRETPVYKTPNGVQIASLKTGVDTEASRPHPDGFSKIVLKVDTNDPAQSVFGYIKTKDLNPASIPERALEMTMAGLKVPTRKMLEPYLQHFQFRKEAIDQKYDTQEIYTHLGDGLSTSPRLFLVFQENTLAGVIHLYDLKLKNAQASQKLKRDYQLIWFLPNSKERSRFINRFNAVIGSAG